MIVRSILVLTLFFSFTLCHGQADFRPGYAVLLSGDTVRGTIDYRGDALMSTTCRLKDAGGSINSYSPAQLQSYRFIDSKYYVSRDVKAEGQTKRVFLEVLIKGKVTILYFRSDINRYFIEKQDLGISELPYKEVIVQQNNKHFNSPSTQHIGILMYYFQDAPELRDDIEKIKKPETDPLIRLAHKYNSKRSEPAEKTAYQKVSPVAAVYFEAIAGPLFVEGPRIETRNTFMGGGHFLFGLPRYNERLFLRTGLTLTSIQLIEYYEVTRKIPIALDYMPMNRRVNLRASYGMNVYNLVATTISLSAGVNVRIRDRISLVAVPEAEFSRKYFLLPGKYFAFNVHAGVNFRLK